MPESVCPRVRFDDPEVSVRELAGEFIVYDAGCNKAHALNPTAASVWKLCDGASPIEHIVETLAEEYDLTPDAARSILLMSLQRLDKARLLREAWSVRGEQVPSRRDALRTIAGVGGAALLPVVYSLLAPGAVQAQSAVNCSQYACHLSQGLRCPDGCRCNKAHGSGRCVPIS